MNNWNQTLFVAICIGSVSGVFYPTLVGLFKKSRPAYNVATKAPRLARIAIFLVAGVLIGVVLAAISFSTFLGSAENQEKLLELGAVSAWFLAFAAGFTASSAAEELTRGKQDPAANAVQSPARPL